LKKILGVDPGGTTGIALIQVIERRISPILWEGVRDVNDDYVSGLISQADVVVVEDWKTRPKKSRQGAFDWDPMLTARVIGSLETLCRIHKVKFHLQQASDKPVGYGLSNQVYKAGAKGKHKEDAMAHAVFYAVKHLHANPVRPS